MTVSIINKLTRVFRSPPPAPQQTPQRSSPFVEGAPGKILHCCYHKAGTHWINRILKKIAKQYDLRCERLYPADLFSDGPKQLSDEHLQADVLLDPHSRIELGDLPPFRGSHMIRDPRDMTISGYFYHLWAHEKWLHVPREQYGGLTYQQHLNSLDIEQGLQAEIRRFAGTFRNMARWDYGHPDVFELRYEQLLVEEEPIFQKMFRHYGFHDEAVRLGLDIARQCNFEARAKRALGQVQENSVLRSGKPGQWQEYFTPAVKETFKELTGDALVTLGYESDSRW